MRDGVRVFDDFGAKHPKAMRGGIEALRRHYPEARVIAVFEAYGPYLARWGRRFALALGGADHVVVAPAVFSADYAPGARFDERWADACPSLRSGSAAARRRRARRWPWRGRVTWSSRSRRSGPAARRLCTRSERRAGVRPSMKILMTNNALVERGGSESYLETVSSELRRLAHDVVFYSPQCGATADRLRRDGFAVVDVRGRAAVGPRRHPRSALQRGRAGARAVPDGPAGLRVPLVVRVRRGPGRRARRRCVRGFQRPGPAPAGGARGHAGQGHRAADPARAGLVRRRLPATGSGSARGGRSWSPAG